MLASLSHRHVTSQGRDTRYHRMQGLNTKQVVHQYISKQLCHLSSTPEGNALFEPILQCVSRYTATRLVLSVTLLIIRVYVNNIAIKAFDCGNDFDIAL